MDIAPEKFPALLEASHSLPERNSQLY